MSGNRPPGSVSGRIVLDTFRSASDPMLAAWLFFRAQMLADEKSTPGVSVSIPTSRAGDGRESRLGVYGVWRLLAPNNREIGRCAALHSTPAAASEAVGAAQIVAATLVASPVRGPQPLMRGWVLRDATAVVVMSPRWYESASEAAAAARTARAMLPGAVLMDGVNIGTESGRRQRLALRPVAADLGKTS